MGTLTYQEQVDFLDQFGLIKYEKKTITSTSKTVYVNQPSGSTTPVVDRIAAGNPNWLKKQIPVYLEELTLLPGEVLISIPELDQKYKAIQLILEYFMDKRIYSSMYLVTKTGLLKINEAKELLEWASLVIAAEKSVIKDYAALNRCPSDYVLLDYSLAVKMLSCDKGILTKVMKPSQTLNRLVLADFSSYSEQSFSSFLKTQDSENIGLVLPEKIVEEKLKYHLDTVLRQLADHIVEVIVGEDYTEKYMLSNSYYSYYSYMQYKGDNNDDSDDSEIEHQHNYNVAPLNQILASKNIQYLQCNSPLFYKDPKAQISFLKLEKIVACVFQGYLLWEWPSSDRELFFEKLANKPIEFMSLSSLSNKDWSEKEIGPLFFKVKNLSLMGYSELFTNFNKITRSFPNIEQLSIEINSSLEGNLINSTQDTNDNFKKLKMLEIKCYKLTADLIAILSFCPSLEVLNLNALNFIVPPLIVPPPGRSFSTVKNLSLKIEDPSTRETFENMISFLKCFPALESLKLYLNSYMPGCTPERQKSTEPFIIQLPENIRLTVRQLSCNIYNFAQCQQIIRDYPNLEDLTIFYPHHVHLIGDSDEVNLSNLQGKLKKLKEIHIECFTDHSNRELDGSVLEIRADANIKRSASNVFSAFLLSAPQLELLTIEKMFFPELSEEFLRISQDGWPCLKVVVIENSDVSALTPFFRKLFSLEKIKLVGSNWEMSSSDKVNPLVFSKLTKIEVEADDKYIDLESSMIRNKSSVFDIHLSYFNNPLNLSIALEILNTQCTELIASENFYDEINGNEIEKCFYALQLSPQKKMPSEEKLALSLKIDYSKTTEIDTKTKSSLREYTNADMGPIIISQRPKSQRASPIQWVLSKSKASLAEDVAHYRCVVANSLYHNSSPSIAAIDIPRVSLEDIQQEYEEKYANDPNYFLWKASFNPKEMSFRCNLRGFSRYEQIQKITISDEGVVLYYDLHSQQYFIVATAPLSKPVEFYYLLYVHKINRLEECLIRTDLSPFALTALNNLAKMSQQLTRDFGSEPKSLDGLPDDASQEEILAAAMQQKKGACGIRSLVFLEMIKQKIFSSTLGQNEIFPIISDMNTINNQVHVWIEMNLQIMSPIPSVYEFNEWVQIDLGGYPMLLDKQPAFRKNNLNLELQSKNSSVMIEKKSSEILSYSSLIDMKQTILSNPFYDALYDQIDEMKKTTDFIEFLCRQTTSVNKANYLIRFYSEERMDAFIHESIAYLGQHNQEHLYVEDLQEVMPYTVHFKNREYQPERVLSDVLNQLKRMKKGDIFYIRCNQSPGLFRKVFDADCTFHDVHFSSEIIRIGLILEKEYQRNPLSIASYFARTIVFPCTEFNVKRNLSLKQNKSDFKGKVIDFDLSASDEWEQILFGGIKFQGKQLVAEPSLLITSREPLWMRIINADPNQRLLQFFITALKNKKPYSLFRMGESYTLDCGIEEVKTDLSTSKNIEIHPYDSSMPLPDTVLNTFTYQHFLNLLTIHQEGGISQKGNLLNAFSKKPMRALTTEQISFLSLKKITDAAAEEECDLSLFEWKGPIPFHKKPFLNENSSSTAATSTSTMHRSVRVIHSNDVDFTVEVLCQHDPAYVPFIVTETTTFSSLFELSRNENHEKAAFSMDHIKYQPGPATITLQEKKKVILFGNFNAELSRGLETLGCASPYLVINGQQIDILPHPSSPNSCSFVIVSANNMISPLLAAQAESQVVRTEDYWSLLVAIQGGDATHVHALKEVYEILKENCPEAHLNYIQCKQMVTGFVEGHHLSNPFKRFFLQQSTHSLLFEQGRYKFKKHREKAEILLRDEKYFLRKIVQGLMRDGCIFAIGKSGIGKTTQIRDGLVEFLRKEKSIVAKLYFGWEEIPACYDDLEPGIQLKIIFQDEGNLVPPEIMDQIMGRFYKNGMVINNRLFAAREDIVFCFAGNYNNYQGRLNHHLLARHGFVFEAKASSLETEISRLKRKFDESFSVLKLDDLSLTTNDFSLTTVRKKQLIHHCFNIIEWFNEKRDQKQENFSSTEEEKTIEKEIVSHYPALITERNWENYLLRILYLLKRNKEEFKPKDEMIVVEQYADFDLFFAGEWIDAQASFEKKVQEIIRLALYCEFHHPQLIALENGREIENQANALFANLQKRSAPRYCQMTSRKKNIEAVCFQLEIQKMCDQYPQITLKPRIGFVFSGPSQTGRSSFLELWVKEMDQGEYKHLVPYEVQQFREEMIECFHKGKKVLVYNINECRSAQDLSQIELIINTFLCGTDMNGRKAKQPGFRMYLIQEANHPLSIAMMNRVLELKFKTITQEDAREFLAFLSCEPAEQQTLSKYFHDAGLFAQYKGRVSPGLMQLRDHVENDRRPSRGMKRAYSSINND